MRGTAWGLGHHVSIHATTLRSAASRVGVGVGVGISILIHTGVDLAIVDAMLSFWDASDEGAKSPSRRSCSPNTNTSRRGFLGPRTGLLKRGGESDEVQNI